MKVSDLQNMDGIYIRTITEGMHDFLYYIIEGTREQHYRLLAELVDLNKPQRSFADFYYKRINSSNIGLLKKHLNEEESILIDRLIQEGHASGSEEEFYMVELTEKVLSLLLHISYTECLFSSFYFTKVPCTIWSNYRGRFLLFTREQEHCDLIMEMAKNIGLLVES